MTDVNEAQIQEIIQDVLGQVMGKQDSSSLPNLKKTQQQDSLCSTSGSATRRLVALGADHGGYELKEMLKSTLSEMGFDVSDVGTHSKAAVDYPDLAHEVAKLVASGKAWRGIMIDGAGIGSCIVANKVRGIRAGMAYDLTTAVNSREHNNTNLLTLGAGLIGINLAKQIVKTWLTTDFGGERHQRRIDKLAAVEEEYLK